jgi:putative hydrolase of HD superfamily
MGERLDAQLAFLLEADRLKGVERRNRVLAGERRENTAEHSWHLALFGLVLAEHSDEPVDAGRVVRMLLLHDLVEIDAGDTFAYDVEAMATKVDRERAAADRIFGLLPADQGAVLRALWDEFEAAETADARFANAVDRLQPVLLNHAAQGASWQEHGVTAGRIREVNGRIAHASASLWAAAQVRIDDAVARGYVDEG